MRIPEVMFLFATVFVHVGCDEAYLDALIDQIYKPVQGAQRQGIFDYQDDDDDDCICVSIGQCQISKANNDGAGLIDIRAGPTDSKCPFLEECCEVPHEVEQKNGPALPERTVCGKRNINGAGFRIFGDADGETQFGEFPWMVLILGAEQYEGNVLVTYKCGGSLIHPEVVLTAAHCVFDRSDSLKVRAGEWDTQNLNEVNEHVDVPVKSVVIHPMFNPSNVHNDIALIFLEKPVPLGGNIDTVCLPEQGEILENRDCFVTGWGKNSFQKNSSYRTILRKVELPMVMQLDCQTALRATRLGQFFKLDPSFICAGGEDKRDACFGDGGSPLSCPVKNDRYMQSGIVSWGIDCGREGVPGVYTNVAYFRDWIDQIISGKGLDTKFYEY